MAKKSAAPKCGGGGDVLARGSAGASATFPSCSHVEPKRFDFGLMTKEEFIAKHGKRAYDYAAQGKFE
jgi:hypothetical protein